MQHIHHLDGDPHNNDPANLALVDGRGRTLEGEITEEIVARAKRQAERLDIRKIIALLHEAQALLDGGASEDDPAFNAKIAEAFATQQRLERVAA